MEPKWFYYKNVGSTRTQTESLFKKKLPCDGLKKKQLT